MSKTPEALRKVAPYLNIGGMLAGCMVVGVGLGYWLDEKWGTKPWLLLAGSLLGMVSGLYYFIKTAMQLNKKKGTEDPEDQDD